MLHHEGDEVVDTACGAEEDLTLAILHIFLDVKRDRLSDTEVLHVLWDIESKLLRQLEEEVDGMTRCEHHGGMGKDAYLLLAEFLAGEPFYFNERSEDQLHSVFFLQREIR